LKKISHTYQSPTPTHKSRLNLKITNHLNFLTRVLRDDAPEGIQLSNAECDQLISVCKSQGVSAIIYKKIEHLPCEGNAATKFKNSLNNEYKIQSLVNMLRQTEEARVLTELKNVDINPILLKGAGISQTHYPQAELRERTDCDLFINLNDIEKTRKLLSKQGYSLGRSTYRSHQFSVTSTLVTRYTYHLIFTGESQMLHNSPRP